MNTTIEIVAFYLAIPNTSPASYTLTYILSWPSTETWDNGANVNVIGWGPAGQFSDTFSPALMNYGSGGAFITRTVTVSPSGLYTPLIQDPSFNDGTPWTKSNATISGGNAILAAGGFISQKVTLQPGTYTITPTVSAGSVVIMVDGFVSAGTITVDETPTTLEFSSIAGATLSSVAIIGTPNVTDTIAPLFVAAVNDNFVVQTAVSLSNVAPATGSPQSATAAVVITALDNTLTPVPGPALQPSTFLNS